MTRWAWPIHGHGFLLKGIFMNERWEFPWAWAWTWHGLTRAKSDQFSSLLIDSETKDFRISISLLWIFINDNWSLLIGGETKEFRISISLLWICISIVYTLQLRKCRGSLSPNIYVVLDMDKYYNAKFTSTYVYEPVIKIKIIFYTNSNIILHVRYSIM